jgi:tetratricopeptide (TPR) repeat protein
VTWRARAPLRVLLASLALFACAPSHFDLGRQALARGDDDEAVRQLGMAVAKDPENPLAWRELARARFRRAEHEDAALAIAEAESLRPGDPSIRLLRGQIALGLGDREAALVDGKYAAEHSQRPAELQQAAILLLRLHAPEPAFAAAKRAIDASNHDPTAYTNLAVLAEEAGRSDIAEDALVRGREHAPDHVGLAEAEAAWLTRHERWADARAAYIALLPRHPTPGLVHLALALLFHQDGKFGEALDHAAKAVAELGDTRADVHYTYVVVLADSGDRKAAQKALAQARRRFPADPDLTRLGAMLAE